MNIVRHTVPIVCDAAGAFTTKIKLKGIVMQARYVFGTLAAGTDISFTEDDTGMVVWVQNDIGAANVTKALRQLVHDTGGTVTTTYDYIALSGMCTITIAQGGNLGAGTLYLYIGT